MQGAGWPSRCHDGGDRRRRLPRRGVASRGARRKWRMSRYGDARIAPASVTRAAAAASATTKVTRSANGPASISANRTVPAHARRTGGPATKTVPTSGRTSATSSPRVGGPEAVGVNGSVVCMARVSIRTGGLASGQVPRRLPSRRGRLPSRRPIPRRIGSTGGAARSTQPVRGAGPPAAARPGRGELGAGPARRGGGRQDGAAAVRRRAGLGVSHRPGRGRRV